MSNIHVVLHSNIPDKSVFESSLHAEIGKTDYDGSVAQYEALKGLTDLSYVAFVWESGSDVFSQDLYAEIPSTANYNLQHFSNGFVDLVKAMTRGNQGLVVDLLSCNLNDPTFIEEVERIRTQEGVNMRYSLNQTGDPDADGDWVLESTGDDVKDLYFTAAIDGWDNILASNITNTGGVIINGTAYLTGTLTGSTGYLVKDVASFTDVSMIVGSSRNDRAYFLLNDGTVTYNFGNTSNTPVVGITGAIFIAGVNDRRASAIDSNGDYWNIDATSSSNFSLATYPDISNAVSTTGGYLASILYIDTTGQLYGRNLNSSGQLGIGNTTSPISTSTPSVGMNNVSKVVLQPGNAQTNFALALQNGSVYGSGLNTSYQLGLGDTVNRNTFTEIIVDGGKTVVDIAASSTTGYAVTSDGRIYSWGTGGDALGLTGASPATVPTLISTISNETIKAVSAGIGFVYALTDDGRVYAWGNNSSGQLGIGNTTNTSTPTLVLNGAVDPGNPTGTLSGVQTLFASDYYLQANTPPAFTSTPITEALKTQTYTYNITTSDDSTITDISLISTTPDASAWLSLTYPGSGGVTTATLSGTVPIGAAASYDIVLRATDDGALTADQSFTLNVYTIPTFDTTPATTATVGTPYTYDFSVNDVDQIVNEISAVILPSWLSFNYTAPDTTGQLTGTPLAANVGANPVQLDISAQYDASNSQAFTITVSAPAPPTPSFSLRRVTKYERAFKSAIVQNRFSSYSGYNVKEKLWRGLRKTDPRKV